MSEPQICDEIAVDAAALMAMPPGAPERARAEAHAATCARCTSALEEGRELLALIAESPLPAPSDAALERASAAVLKESDTETALRGGFSVFAAVVAAWALPLVVMRASIGEDPYELWYVLGLLAIAASIATVFWSRLAAAAFPVLSVVTALYAGRGSALAPRVGLHCASIEAMTAVFAGATAWLLFRALARSPGARPLLPSPRRASLEVAAVGGGALAGHAVLNVGCSAAQELPHLLVFHTGPVTLAVLLALVIVGTAARRGVEVGS